MWPEWKEENNRAQNMEQKSPNNLREDNPNMAKRRKKITSRELPPDPEYGSVLVTKLINYVMRKGKKSLARRIVYEAFEIIKEKLKKDPLEVFERALKNAGPILEVRPKRIGGATYQVPMEVKEHRRIALALRWIVEAARYKKGKSMEEKLAQELIDAYNNTGTAVKRKETMHKMAEANKAFAHYA